MTPTWLLRRSAAPEPGTVDETAPGTDAEDAPAEPEAAEPESPPPVRRTDAYAQRSWRAPPSSSSSAAADSSTGPTS